MCSSGVMYRLECRNSTESCIADGTPLLAGAGKGFPIKPKTTDPRVADLNKLGRPRGLVRVLFVWLQRFPDPGWPTLSGDCRKDKRNVDL